MILGRDFPPLPKVSFGVPTRFGQPPPPLGYKTEQNSQKKTRLEARLRHTEASKYTYIVFPLDASV